MTPAIIMQIGSWAAQLIASIIKIAADATAAAKAGNAPTLEDLDKLLAADQARMAQDRYAAAKAAADEELRKAAAAEFDTELAKELKKP